MAWLAFLCSTTSPCFPLPVLFFSFLFLIPSPSPSSCVRKLYFDFCFVETRRRRAGRQRPPLKLVGPAPPSTPGTRSAPFGRSLRSLFFFVFYFSSSLLLLFHHSHFWYISTVIHRIRSSLTSWPGARNNFFFRGGGGGTSNFFPIFFFFWRNFRRKIYRFRRIRSNYEKMRNFFFRRKWLCYWVI